MGSSLILHESSELAFTLKGTGVATSEREADVADPAPSPIWETRSPGEVEMGAIWGLAGLVAGTSIGDAPSCGVVVTTTCAASIAGAMFGIGLRSFGHWRLVRVAVWHIALAALGAGVAAGASMLFRGASSSDVPVVLGAAPGGVLGLMMRALGRGNPLGAALAWPVSWPGLILIAGVMGGGAGLFAGGESDTAAWLAGSLSWALCAGARSTPAPGTAAWAVAFSGALAAIGIGLGGAAPWTFAAAGALAGAIAGEVAQARS